MKSVSFRKACKDTAGLSVVERFIKIVHIPCKSSGEC